MEIKSIELLKENEDGLYNIIEKINEIILEVNKLSIAVQRLEQKQD